MVFKSIVNNVSHVLKKIDNIMTQINSAENSVQYCNKDGWAFCPVIDRLT